MLNRKFLIVPVFILCMSSLAGAQLTGILDGVVKDAQGGVLPGVSITLTTEGAVAPRTLTADVDGSYRFPNLPPGTYTLVYEMPGFATLRREGIVTRAQTTITVNVTLDLATVAETITVTGESPVVDVKTTRVGGDFDSTALESIPSATDMWSVLAQSPGIRMTAYDVGGSHKSQQSGYESFGVTDQVRIIKEGVNPTEGTGGSGGYWDYYNVAEYQVSAVGADVEMSTPGANIVAIVKSGGNNFSTLTHLDYTSSGMVTDNIDDAYRARGGSSAPVLRFYEFHTDLGGPIVKDKAWFYGSYNRFYIDRQISGQDPAIGTDLGLFHTFGGKITWQFSEKDTFVGFSEWNRKQKPYRGLSLTVPPDSVGPQHAWHWLHKAEWQRVWSDRMFSKISLAYFGYNFSQVPQQGIPTYKEGNFPRIDTATDVVSGPFWGPPFNYNRLKPQSLGQFGYYLPDKAGSHNFKFGWDWMIEGLNFYRDQISPGANYCAPDCSSGPIRYYDNSSLGRPNNVDEIRMTNLPTLARDRNQKWDFYLQDTWTINERVTLNLGVRIGSQFMYYNDTERNPYLGAEFPEFFPTDPVVGDDLRNWWNAAPRIGLAWDLTGEGTTIVKAYTGRYYGNNSTLSEANPGGMVTLDYEFLDPNQNGIYDGRQELGNLLSKSGGSVAQFADDWRLMYVDEFSVSFEREVLPDLGARVSYVRKMLRRRWDDYNAVRAANLTVPFTTTCTGCPSGFEGQTLNLLTVPDELAGATGVIFAQTPDDGDNYDTIQFAVNRRMRGGLYMQGVFDYQWRDELRTRGVSTSPLNADPIGKGFAINHSADFANRQNTTNWNLKFLVRYDMQYDIGLSFNLRHQSGFPWAPIHRVSIPNVGTQAIYLEDMDQNRADNVTIVDFRIDKVFDLGGSYRLTGMFDIGNLFNSNPENNFIVTTGSRFNNIIEWLPGRTLKIGIRFTF